MKVYKGVKLYCKLTPDIWYRNDDPFSPDFKEIEPYEFIHKFKNKSSVSYVIDKFGFRNINKLESKLWFFGCSLTFCESLDLEKGFPYLISQELNMPFYNFGTLGASIDLIAKLLYKLKDSLIDKIVIVLLPTTSRYETLINKQYHNFVSNHENYLENLPIKHFNDSLSYKLLKNIMLLKLLTSDINIHFFSFENNEMLNQNLKINLLPDELHVDYANDDSHFGEITNKNIANFILNVIK